MELKTKIKSILATRPLQQAAFVYVGALINGGSLFLLNVILARGLSKELFGIFSLSVLVLSTVAEMSDFGLNAGLLRFAPYYISTNQENKLKQILKIIWQWRVSLAIILTVGCIVLAHPLSLYLFKQPEVTIYLMYTSLGIGGVILLGFLATWLQAKQRFFYGASLQSLKGFLRLLIVVILYLFHVRNLFVYLSVYIFVPWLLFIFNFHVFPAGFRKQKADDEVKEKVHSQLAKFSFWLTVSSLTTILASKTDQVMISRYLGLEEVAVFTVAYQLIQFFPLIYNSISSVLVPKASSLKTKQELKAVLKRAFLWVSVVAVVVGVFVFPSQYFIPLFYGVKYVSAMPVYLILAYSLLLNVMVIPFSIAISMFNKTILTAISGIIQIVLNIAGSMVFIPLYGIMGVPLTFALSMVFQVIWNVAWATYLFKTKEIIIE
jgi:O-antigen/teichoic acid export membrane protein